MIQQIPNDTDERSSAVQVDLLRKAGPARRVELAFSLSDSVIGLARRAIARAHPEISDTEQAFLFVEVHYGRDLAERYRAHLERTE